MEASSVNVPAFHLNKAAPLSRAPVMSTELTGIFAEARRWCVDSSTTRRAMSSGSPSSLDQLAHPSRFFRLWTKTGSSAPSSYRSH